MFGISAAALTASSMILGMAQLPILVVLAIPTVVAAWLTRSRGWSCERCAWKRIAAERRERRKGTTVYIHF